MKPIFPIYFYPGNKAPGKVNLVSPLVIINVTSTNATFLSKKHNAIKIENETFNSYTEEPRMDLGSFVFAMLLHQAGNEKGAEGEGRTPGRRS